MKHLKVLAFLVLALLFIITACSGGGGGSSSSNSSSGSAVSSGFVFMDAPVTGATVNLYTLNPNGTKGALLGTAVTGTNGSYSITLQPVPTTPIIALASGGSYSDKAAGSVTLSSSDILQAVLSSGTTTATISPLTTIAEGRAVVMAAGGASLTTAISAANTGVAQQYNLPDIISITPPDPNDASGVTTASRDEIDYLLVLAGLADEANTLNVRMIDLTNALASDMSDGTLDGGKSSASIQLVTKTSGTITLSASAGISGVQTGITNFGQSVNNNTNIPGFTIIPTPELIPATPSSFVPIATLPAWISGHGGSADIPGIAGSTSAACTLKSGSVLPSWLVLNNCTLTGGAPILPSGVSESISAPFTITVSDPANPQNSHDVVLMAAVVEPSPVITPVTATCYLNESCNEIIASVTGGMIPYSYRQGTFANGPLPWGTSVSLFGLGNEAMIQGTPTVLGNYSFEVCVTDFAHFGACTTTEVDVIPAQCTYSIAPNSSSQPATANSSAITVTTSADCSWTATSSASWLTITGGASGTGNGAVSYSYSANTSASPRTATITIGDQVFTLTQAGAVTGVTGTWNGTLNMPGAAYPGCTAQIISFSLTLNEDSNMNITGSTSNGRTISSGSRSDNSITVTLNTMYGSRGPYVWSWDGTTTITGSMPYFCYDLATNALQFEGTETFSVTQ